MYFENEAGETYIENNKVAVLKTSEGRYSFESSDPFLVSQTYDDFISILNILENEIIYFEQLEKLFKDEFK